MTLEINPEYHALLPSLTKEEYESLKQSIMTDGQHYPIVANYDGVILDGHNRFKIIQDLGREIQSLDEDYIIDYDYIVMAFDSVFDEMLFVIDSNIKRRHLTSYQLFELEIIRAEIIAKQKAEERKEKARESAELRRDSKTGQLTSNKLIGSPKRSKLATIRTDDVVAKNIGVSPRQVTKMQKIHRLADEKLKEEVRKGIKSVNQAHNIVRIKEKQQEIKRIGSPLLPEGKYDVILADPPWQYGYGGSKRGKADIHYATMSTEDICGLPVPEMVADDAILYLWVTNPFVEDGLAVASAWGFEYKTNFVWVKDKIGTGFYNRAMHELLYICRRGDFPHPADEDRLPSVIRAVRTKHSMKPEVVYEMIERMHPNRKYLELFSRNRRDGWKMWGFEA